MSIRLLGLLAILMAFGILSAVALNDVGYFGIIRPHFQSWGEAQVFADLVILAAMACRWMARDAQTRGVAAWPFMIITIVSGSFGPLLYLVVREIKKASYFSEGKGAKSMSSV